MLVALIGLLVPLSNAYAFTSGLLGTKTLNLGPDANTVTTTSTLATDDDSTTYVRTSAYGGTTDTLWYEFTTGQTIAQVNVDVTTLYYVEMWDSAGTRLHYASYGADVKQIDFTTAYTDVKKIALLYPTSSGYMDIFEFNAYSEATDANAPVDTTAPAAPIGVTATAGDAKVTLTWDANTETDLAGYKVYRDNVYLATTTAAQYDDLDVINGTTYTYVITAYDTAGNESAASTSVTATPEVPSPFSVSFAPNMDSIIVQVSGGTSPYTVTWDTYTDTFISTSYTITGLTANTDYTVTVTDDAGNTYSEIVNTGNVKGYTPPNMPNPTQIFQRMINGFGDAGTVGAALILAAVGLGVICILGIWGWRLSKKWLAASK
jgi:hypothetical protein